MSCQTQQKNTVKEEYIPKSISLEDFDIPKLSSKATDSIKEWASFRNLTQVMVSMAPYKTRNADQILLNTPDSVLIYKRLYAKNSKTILDNISVDKDWRTLEHSKDTIYRLQKRNEVDKTNLSWNEYLLADIPYTFSVFVKNVSIPHLTIAFADALQNPVAERSFALDSLYASAAGPYSQVVEMKDNWKEFRLTFTPTTDAMYALIMKINEDSKAGNSLLFYRPTLQIPLKYFAKIGQSSERIVQEQTEVKSSYNSIYFWLTQLEDEIKHLLDEDDFPKTIHNSVIKSRFHLFNTQIHELSDNIQNNPELTDQQTKEKIRQIQDTYSNIIERINKAYDSNLEELMRKIMRERDTITTETMLIKE
ncbi:MAG: hypothetical protein Q4G08_05140 [Capnocytophaga sp.]|nr:hypothetical protein [Capnocytophaga sp.]